MSSGHKADQDAADAAAALRDEEPVASGATADASADTPDGRERHDEACADPELGGSAADGSGECDLADEVAALKDQLLRERAEFQNVRRRMRRDREKEIEAARTEVLLGVADFIDDLERALQPGEDADAATLREGVSAIEKKLTGLLEKWGFRRFSAEGEPLDPGRHVAIATEESGAHAAGTVVETTRAGYLLHDRVVRYAQVKVAQPLSGSNEEPARAPGDASADTKEGT